MQYQYATGRDYGTPQVLTINAPQLPDDPIADVRVTFNDTARNISGAVSVMACECWTTSSMGAAVLREYDAGRYDQI